MMERILVPVTVFLVALGALFISSVLHSLIRLQALPRSILVSGSHEGDGFFKRIIAYFRAWRKGRAALRDGYLQMSKHGRPFIAPSSTLAPQVILPPEYLSFLDKSHESLDARLAQFEATAIIHLFHGVDWKSDALPTLTRRCFSRQQLQHLHTSLLEEIRGAFTTHLPASAIGTEVSLVPFMDKVLSKIVSRLFLGPVMSKNEKLVRHLDTMTHWVDIGQVVVSQMTPQLLRPTVGWLFQFPISFYAAHFKRVWVPELISRRECLDSRPTEKDSRPDGPLDVTTSMVKLLEQSSSTGGNFDSLFGSFFILCNVAARAMFPTTVSAMWCILHQKARGDTRFFDLLRSEIDNALRDPSAWTCFDTFSSTNMPLLEAALIESLRFRPPSVNSTDRLVVDPRGLTLPDGTHVPKGTYLYLPLGYMAFDDQIHPNAQSFDPFRFLMQTETGAYKLKEECRFTLQNPQYPVLGYGRRHCPGRFLAEHVIKMLAAQMIFHFDMDLLTEGSAQMALGHINVPTEMKVSFKPRLDSQNRQ